MQSFLARDPGLSEYSLLLPKNGHTRTQLLEQFSGQNRAILLIPFDYLSFGDIVSAKFLFVTKLQFPNSFLPTVTRLKQTLKEKRSDPFRQFDLPYALTLLQYTLHQMDPHTLRSVFMLDNRSFSSAYADRIRTVLPTPSLFLLWKTRRACCSILTDGCAIRLSRAFAGHCGRTTPHSPGIEGGMRCVIRL